jgi:hypothetical protein
MEICAFDLQVQIFYLKSQNYPSTKEKKKPLGGGCEGGSATFKIVF